MLFQESEKSGMDRTSTPSVAARYVEDGVFDAGITGKDWVIETNSEVVAVADDVSRENSVTLEHSSVADGGMWIAARAYGKQQAVAHTAPVYVVVNDRGFIKSDAVADIIGRMLPRLDEFDTVQVDVDSELETWSVGEPLTAMFGDQRLKILQRVDDARRFYAAMLDRP